jgi:hypothetical protein
VPNQSPTCDNCAVVFLDNEEGTTSESTTFKTIHIDRIVDIACPTIDGRSSTSTTAAAWCDTWWR